MPSNAREAFREGTWCSPRPNRLAVLALLAALFDLATAAVVSDGGGVSAAGHEWDPLVAVIVLVVGKLLLLAVAWLSFGPVSTYVAVYVVVTMGFYGGGVAALELLTTVSPYAALSASARYLLAPVVAIPVGVIAVDVVHEDPPWVEVGLVATALLLAEADIVLTSLLVDQALLSLATGVVP